MLNRDPFVWQVQIHREVLDDEVLRLRDVPYTVWRQTVVAPLVKTVRARDDKTYQLRVTAQFVRGSQSLRVTLRLARPGLFRRHVMRQTFVVTPDNRFVI